MLEVELVKPSRVRALRSREKEGEMKVIVNIALVTAVISLILGIVSRLTVVPIPITPGSGVEAHAFLDFTNTCLLFAITLILLQIAKKK